MNIWHDIRYAFRTLARKPGLVVIAVMSLALGIGANTLVFGTARALLLRPLPIPQPEDVFFLQVSSTAGFTNHSFPNYVDFRDRAADTANLAAYRVAQAAIDPGGGARSSWGYLASGNYFDVLGIQPAIGRFFTPAEDVGRNIAPFIVLSHDYWTAAFNADPLVAGRAVRINGQTYTVLGVAPKDFHGTEVFFRADYWIPMTMAPQLEGATWIDSRTARNVYVAGRLQSGVTRSQAGSTLTALAARLRREYPGANRDLLVTMTDVGLFGDVVRTPARAFMGVTLVLALLVLLAACTNLASLLAARVVDRFRELAIRLSLGATRRQVARQLFVETLLLSVTGGAAGMVLASVLLNALTQWRPAVGDLPLAIDVRPDMQVIGFAALTSLVAALLAVGAAARRAWRVSPGSLMRGPADGVHIGRWNVRDALLVVQVSLCCFLVVCCFVSGRGLGTALNTPLGLKVDDVMVASFDLNQAGYDRTRGSSFRTEVLDAIAALPGIDGVTFTSSIPLTTDQSTDDIASETAVAGEPGISANGYIVPPGYFGVMQTRLMAGREFALTDGRVVIVNETLARRLFGATNVVGRSIRRAPGQPPIEIIGIAEDGKYAMPGEAPRPAVFWPANQLYRSSTQLLVRSTLPEEQVVNLVRQAIATLDPALPVSVQGSLANVTSLAFLPAKAAAATLGAFGILAVMLALTGIYGLAAYSVTARTREIGIRVAVGGGATQVLRAILGRTAVVLVTGAGAGTLLAIAASPLLAMVVYQASSRDSLILIAAAGLMVLVGLVATWAPAGRVLRIDPAITLREN